MKAVLNKTETDEPFERIRSVGQGVKSSAFHAENHRFKSDTEYKICTNCKQNKSLNDYCKSTKNSDGLQSWCKQCKNEKLKKYYKENPKKRAIKDIEKRRKYKLNYYHNHKISFNISRRMRVSLKTKKRLHWENLVDFTLLELMYHLENKFEHGMNWENYGSWHIDHKKPIKSFNITSVDCVDFKKCWSLSNLQPMWAIDNIKKGAKCLTFLS